MTNGSRQPTQGGGSGNWDTVGINVCYSAEYVAKWVLGALSAANEREMASEPSRRKAKGSRGTTPLSQLES